MTSTLEKDEIVFCINCVQAIYPGIWSDSAFKIRELIQDVYDENIPLATIEELIDERIVEQDEYSILYNNYGFK
jgi:hypothetical protein